MDKNQTMLAKTSGWHTLPTHIHEFLNDSAQYLGVEMHSQSMAMSPWLGERKVEEKRNNQEVCYATNRLSP